MQIRRAPPSHAACFLLSLMALAACGAPNGPSPEAMTEPATAQTSAAAPAMTGELSTAATRSDPGHSGQALPAVFDCLRETGGVVVAAHRGGPLPGFAENGLETLQVNRAAGLSVFEVDVASSRDGVLFLLHDRTLDRTTTGSGPVEERDWDLISTLQLVDNDGRPTGHPPPRLRDVLIWARQAGAVIELDRKSSARFADIISVVRETGASDHVILITYSDDQAAEVARLAPDLMMTASASSPEDVARLRAAGVSTDRLIAWTGTRDPDPDSWQILAEMGVEAAFGTLGRPGGRLDDTYLADGDASEYQALADGGLVLLATDAPREAAEVLRADDGALTRCRIGDPAP